MNYRDNTTDDNRTIADMSEISRQPLILPRLPKKQKQTDPAAREEPEAEISKEERGAYIRGALGAGLAIAGVFIAAGAAVIALMLTVWR